MFRITILSVSILVILFSFGFTDDNNNQKIWDNIVETQQVDRDSKQIKVSMVKLSHFVDLWHKANLKGDNKKVFQYEQDILAVVQYDLQVSHKFVSKKEQMQLKGKMNKTHVKANSNLGKMNSIYNAKKRLIGSFSKSTSFSNKLRLVGDYRELMRRELDLSIVRLAEDWEGTANDLQEEQQD